MFVCVGESADTAAAAAADDDDDDDDHDVLSVINYNAQRGIMTDVVESDIGRQFDDDDDVHRQPLLDTTNNIVIIGQSHRTLLHILMMSYDSHVVVVIAVRQSRRTLLHILMMSYDSNVVIAQSLFFLLTTVLSVNKISVVM